MASIAAVKEWTWAIIHIAALENAVGAPSTDNSESDNNISEVWGLRFTGFWSVLTPKEHDYRLV